MHIREFNEDTDLNDLYRCVGYLQDFERILDPSKPKGSDICVAFVNDAFKRCVKYAGKILVGVIESRIIGYTSIYSKMVSDAIEDGPEEYGYIGDLFILEEYRGHGYGRKLIREAEMYAKSAGSKTIRIGVLAANSGAVELYESLNYQPLAIELKKNL